ncbi:AraC-like DNA-binding protein [Catenuloplanes nepalensis]|uniref:AraC-like DNA-binding protein n=1 Tax=Catenuloplanes nepalensis TaxID=587533 RepID=A0ABT9N6W5_9ACTN|nr:helix-turn-helix transcriptional regulator [Catenuloplanes nepalensis]MDP9799430.1 AraC-like DNA-binding protein [Catenuloplanes nepalensis]
MQPMIFDGRDVSEVERFMAAFYSRMRVGAVGEDTHTRITREVMTPEAAFDELDYGFHLDFDAEPQPYLVLCDVVTNSVHLDGEDGGQTFRAGDSFLICRPGLPYRGVVHAARLSHLTLHPDVLTEVASSVDAAAAPVRVLDHRPVSRRAAIELRSAVAHVREAVLGAPVPPGGLVVSAACQYLAAHMLDTFPNTAVLTPTAGDRRDARPDTLRRAVSFIEADPDTALTVADIARAAYVTPRALQLTFRRHLDTTPMAYLRRVRLDLAHEDLRAATDGDGQTVTAVAARWGFTGSQLAQRHRAAYGQTPGQALRG